MVWRLFLLRSSLVEQPLLLLYYCSFHTIPYNDLRRAFSKPWPNIIYFQRRTTWRLRLQINIHSEAIHESRNHKDSFAGRTWKNRWKSWCNHKFGFREPIWRRWTVSTKKWSQLEFLITNPPNFSQWQSNPRGIHQQLVSNG